MLEFSKPFDKNTTDSLSFEIINKTDQLEIETDRSSKFETDRHTFKLTKEEAQEIVSYLNKWINNEI